jgi:hypothetical protein
VFAWNGHGQCFFLIAEGRSKIPDQGNLRPRQGRLKAEAAVGITRRPIYMIYNKYIGINWQGKNDLPMFASVALSTGTPGAAPRSSHRCFPCQTLRVSDIMPVKRIPDERDEDRPRRFLRWTLRGLWS